MWSIRKLVACLLVVTMLAASAALSTEPASAVSSASASHPSSGGGPGPGGGGGGGGVFALAMSPGHVGGGRSYPSCNWKHVWKTSLWDSIWHAVKTAIATLTGANPPGTQEAELVLDIDANETNLYLDGVIAELLGRDSSFVVSYEGAEVTLVHKVINRLIGTPQVGEFNQVSRDKDAYHHNDFYPAVQRGTWTGGELWWDPYYIPETEDGNPYDAGDPGCDPGWGYFPRNSDPITFVPDLQDYMHSLLPPVVPELRPLDSVGDWAYVQVPLNFTTDASSLGEVEATASVIDPDTGNEVWAEATAVPVSVVFEPGDGSDSARCDIDDAIEAFDPEVPGLCSFTYLDSSNVESSGVFEAALIVEWRGEYRSSSSGALVNFPIEPTYLEFDLPVAEARPSVAITP